MREKPLEGFPYARRVLSLKVRCDGSVRAMRLVLRAGTVTYRRSVGLVDKDNAADLYTRLFSSTEFDAIHVRVWAGGKWTNPQGGADVEF